MKASRPVPAVLLGVIVLLLAGMPATAEIDEVVLAQQNGISYLPMMVMERQRIIERQAAARGIAGLRTRWVKLAGPSAISDGLLAGSLHFSANGPPSLAILWDRTNGEVKAVGALISDALYLDTRNPSVKSVRDLTEKDKIAVPAVKVSSQAIALQMLAEQAFGAGQHFRLDALTVSLAHPDAMAAVLNPNGEVTAHFSSSPFHQAELKAGLRIIASSMDVQGGYATQLVVTSTAKFRSENPKVTAAVVAALDEAIAWINADKRRAARLYLDVTNDKRTSLDEATAVLEAPGHEYTRTPHHIGGTFAFMARIGLIRKAPRSWKDLFFPEAQDLPGD